jgi:hypothetical protein
MAALQQLDGTEQLQRLDHAPTVAELAEAHQSDLEVLAGACEVLTADPSERADLADGGGGPAALLLHLWHGFLEELLSLLRRARQEPDGRGHHPRQRGLGAAGRGPLQGRSCLPGDRGDGVGAVGPVGEGQQEQGLAAVPIRDRPRQGECGLKGAGCLLAVTGQEQKPAQEPDQPHRGHSLVTVQEPLQRDPQIV